MPGLLPAGQRLLSAHGVPVGGKMNVRWLCLERRAVWAHAPRNKHKKQWGKSVSGIDWGPRREWLVIPGYVRRGRR